MSAEDSEFGKMMRDAVAIKSAQLSQVRKKFDSLPQFHQAGLYYADNFETMRNDTLEIKLAAFENKKREGTELFTKGEYQKALFKYEESLAVWKWIESSNKQWRNSGIDDTELTYMQEDLTDKAMEAMITAYLNIALCNIKIQAFKEAVTACDEAIKLDVNNVKALYRKAMALTLPAGSDIDDYKEAMKLLQKALKIDPRNISVRDKLLEFKQFVKEQKAKSKETFHCFFKKPTNISVATEPKQNPLDEIHSLMERGTLMVNDLKSRGLKQEARKLKANLDKMNKWKSKMMKELLDFENPTEKMREEARKFGLDLDDPLVRRELKRMRNRKSFTMPTEPKQVVESWSNSLFILGLIVLGVILIIVFWYEQNR